MRKLFVQGAIGCAAILASSAQAQSIEASRYVNGQGIEVIQGRTPPVASAAEKKQDAAPASGSVTTPRAAQAVRTVDGGATAADPRMRVSAAEQRARDKDRLAILNEELGREMGEYNAKSKILNSPSMRDKLPPAELARVRELAADHEKNIQTLMSEIAGVRK